MKKQTQTLDIGAGRSVVVTSEIRSEAHVVRGQVVGVASKVPVAIEIRGKGMRKVWDLAVTDPGGTPRYRVPNP